MKMNEKFLCCDHCFETIAKKSTTAARVWINLCSFQIKKNGVFALNTGEFEDLRKLEILGFITTTETFRSILVKVNGQRLDLEGTYFCCGDCNHG